MNIRQTKIIGMAALTALVAACSSLPDRNAALEQAHSSYNAAAADPQVTRLAADELQRASAALAAADEASRKGASLNRVDHLAYLASQSVTIARDTAAARSDEASLAKAAAERDRMRLAQRTNEVDQAKAQLADAQRDNERKTAEVANANATAVAANDAAERERARVERRDARLREIQMQMAELQARKTDRGMVVTLGDVLFNTGQATLLPASQRHMEKLAAFFRKYPEQRATIEGYTDSVGTNEYNQALSQRRAQAVMSTLVSLGVAPDHLTTRAYGEDQPVASNDTQAGRQLNRRVEILFAAPSEAVSMK